MQINKDICAKMLSAMLCATVVSSSFAMQGGGVPVIEVENVDDIAGVPEVELVLPVGDDPFKKVSEEPNALAVEIIGEIVNGGRIGQNNENLREFCGKLKYSGRKVAELYNLYLDNCNKGNVNDAENYFYKLCFWWEVNRAYLDALYRIVVEPRQRTSNRNDALYSNAAWRIIEITLQEVFTIEEGNMRSWVDHIRADMDYLREKWY